MYEKKSARRWADFLKKFLIGDEKNDFQPVFYFSRERERKKRPPESTKISKNPTIITKEARTRRTKIIDKLIPYRRRS